MDSKTLVSNILKQVINGGMTAYKDLFLNTDLEKVTDEYWKRALSLFHKLDDQERSVLFEIIRQISVDTTAEILSILDGVSWLENQKDDFKLTMENSSEQLNGDLKDIFLEMDDESDFNDIT